MTTKLTFYGGVNEIGDKKILLQTDDCSILLNLGREMGEYGKFFSHLSSLNSKIEKQSMIPKTTRTPI